MTAAGPPIVAEDLVVTHRATTIVGPVSFTVPARTTLGVWGPSGIGKSTLLRALSGLLPDGLVASGALSVLGADPQALPPGRLADLRARAVLVGQEPVIFPGSILANALFGLRHVVRDTAGGLRARALQAIRDAGLWDEVAHRLDAVATTLSVGQRQRLCLARALALQPEILLLDEPTSALDARSRTQVQHTLERARDRLTVVLVSHDRSQLEALADTVLELGTSTTQNPGVTAPQRS
jgi:phosphate transport system ATP-binding protein